MKQAAFKVCRNQMGDMVPFAKLVTYHNTTIVCEWENYAALQKRALYSVLCDYHSCVVCE